jgi:hypothetical protein
MTISIGNDNLFIVRSLTYQNLTTQSIKLQFSLEAVIKQQNHTRGPLEVINKGDAKKNVCLL